MKSICGPDLRRIKLTEDMKNLTWTKNQEN